MQLFNMTYEEAKEMQEKGICPVWRNDYKCRIDIGETKTCDECIEKEYRKANECSGSRG